MIQIPTVPLASLTAHNCSNSPDYTAKNFPKLFTGRTFINQSLTTAAVDSSRYDDSLNPASPVNISKRNLHEFMGSDWKGKIINFWQAFLYDGVHHPAVGYLNNDPAVIARQMEDSAERGYDVVTLDLYGPQFPGAGNDFVLDQIAANAVETNQTFFATFDQQCLTSATNGFKSAEYQQKMIDYINHIAVRYFDHPAYEKYNGRPLLFFWGFSNTGLGAHLDWKAIRAATKGNALFIFYQNGGFYVPTSDGAFGWMPTGPGAGDPGGLNYIRDWNAKMAAHPEKLGVGTVFPRFNGTNTFDPHWSQGKYLSGEGGMTWVNGWALNSAFAKTRNLPYVMTPTWDDNQEGSDLICGVDNDIVLSAAIHGNILSWKVNGHEETVSSYDIYGAVTGQDVYKLGSVAPGSAESFDLTGKLLPYGGSAIYVQAVGKPSVVNKLVKAA